jgi:hypothetical protein
LRRGLAPAGGRIVSARTLEECWRPHIDLPTSPRLDPDLTGAGYAMGWISQAHKDGRRLVWHNGDIDGFTTLIAFFPEEDLGLVVLTNMFFSRAASFYMYVLNLLLESRFGLNRGVNETVVAVSRDAARRLTEQAEQARPVDAGAIAPFLGYYERGYRLAYDAAGALRLYVSSRATRLLAMPDGSYVAASDRLAGTAVRFARDRMGAPVMELEGAEMECVERVRWLSGPA